MFCISGDHQVFDRVVQDKPVCPRDARLRLSPLITVLVVKHPPLIEQKYCFQKQRNML